MPFRFYIDSQLTDQPVNDFELSTSIVRDDSLNGLLITQDVELIYNANNNLASTEISGFTYIENLLNDGICNEADIIIYDEVSSSETYVTYRGVIKIPDVKIDEHKKLLYLKISDRSYYSYIKNNKNIDVNLSATKTKSLEDITPIDPYTLDLFNSNGCAFGSASGVEFEGFKVTDVFRLIISAITDNKLGFQSDYLSGLDNQLFLLKGQALINPISVFPLAPSPLIKISFEKLFNEINKIKNIVFWVDESDENNPILRIENYEASFSSLVNHNFSDIKSMLKYTNTKNIYSAVTVGSDTTTDGLDPIYTWDQARSYFGWRIEEFFPLGQCNIDSELNLVNEFVLDNNVIQDTGLFLNESNIDKIFLIECDNVDDILFTATAVQYEYFGDGGCYYNLGLNNFNKMQRHSVKFETNFGNFLGTGQDGFRALLGLDQVDNIIYQTASVFQPNHIPPGGLTVDPAEYVNITTNGGYDGNGNYSIVNFEYTVPADGTYSFLHSLQVAIAAVVSQEYFTIYSTVTLYDAVLNVKGQNTVEFDFVRNGLIICDSNLVADAVAGDIVQGSYRFVYHPNGVGSQQIPRFAAVSYTSFLECNGTPDGGIVITSGNNNVNKYVYEFEYEINETDWRSITQNITQLYGFEKDGVTRYGWIENMKHNNQTGLTQIKLITSDALTTQ